MTLNRFLRYLIKRSRENIQFGQAWNENAEAPPVDLGPHLCILALAKRMQGLLALGDLEAAERISKRLKKQVLMVDKNDRG